MNTQKHIQFSEETQLDRIERKLDAILEGHHISDNDAAERKQIRMDEYHAAIQMVTKPNREYHHTEIRYAVIDANILHKEPSEAQVLRALEDMTQSGIMAKTKKGRYQIATIKENLGGGA